MNTFQLTLKSPTEALSHWLSNELTVQYVNHSLLDQSTGEYIFTLARHDGAQFTVEGLLEELFIENFNLKIADNYCESNIVCPDMSESIETITKAAEYVLRTGSPAVVQYGVTDDQGKEHVSPVYLLTERAYKYMLSKCTEDELWDLGFRGCNPDHIKTVKSPLLFKDAISNHKA